MNKGGQSFAVRLIGTNVYMGPRRIYASKSGASGQANGWALQRSGLGPYTHPRWQDQKDWDAQDWLLHDACRDRGYKKQPEYIAARAQIEIVKAPPLEEWEVV